MRMQHVLLSETTDDVEYVPLSRFSACSHISSLSACRTLKINRPKAATGRNHRSFIKVCWNSLKGNQLPTGHSRKIEPGQNRTTAPQSHSKEMERSLATRYRPNGADPLFASAGMANTRLRPLAA